ncbi:acyltransferase domain-containing protein [Xanthomonas sp. NCPPB 1325]|uniref:acyltransferase domain-containing protein n=1 Tax=Xanthomonas sp. NCPPB 1325 TaxID=487529 RepID=UPI003556B56C
MINPSSFSGSIQVSKSRVTFLFSGQGSQSFQMARPLYERNPVFRKWMDLLDDVASELAGESILATLYHRDHARTQSFYRTLLSHPAIYMTEYSLARTLIAAGVEPDATLGASLGTFAAAAVAGCIDARDALAAVIRHAQALEASCAPGTMIAIFAEASVFDDAKLGRHSELAALNFDGHFVVAATLAGAVEVEQILRKRQLTFQRLPVEFAYHSRHVRAAELPLKVALDKMEVREGNMPVVCCASADPAKPMSHAHFVAAVREPIYFGKAIERMELSGHYDYIDVGPSGTLATFVKYAIPSATSRTHTILTIQGNDLERLAHVISRFTAHNAFVA